MEGIILSGCKYFIMIFVMFIKMMVEIICFLIYCELVLYMVCFLVIY